MSMFEKWLTIDIQTKILQSIEMESIDKSELAVQSSVKKTMTLLYTIMIPESLETDTLPSTSQRHGH